MLLKKYILKNTVKLLAVLFLLVHTTTIQAFEHPENWHWFTDNFDHVTIQGVHRDQHTSRVRGQNVGLQYFPTVSEHGLTNEYNVCSEAVGSTCSHSFQMTDSGEARSTHITVCDSRTNYLEVETYTTTQNHIAYYNDQASNVIKWYGRTTGNTCSSNTGTNNTQYPVSDNEEIVINQKIDQNKAEILQNQSTGLTNAIGIQTNVDTINENYNSIVELSARTTTAEQDIQSNTTTVVELQNRTADVETSMSDIATKLPSIVQNTSETNTALSEIDTNILSLQIELKTLNKEANNRNNLLGTFGSKFDLTNNKLDQEIALVTASIEALNIIKTNGLTQLTQTDGLIQKTDIINNTLTLSKQIMTSIDNKTDATIAELQSIVTQSVVSTNKLRDINTSINSLKSVNEIIGTNTDTTNLLLNDSLTKLDLINDGLSQTAVNTLNTHTKLEEIKLQSLDINGSLTAITAIQDQELAQSASINQNLVAIKDSSGVAQTQRANTNTALDVTNTKLTSIGASVEPLSDNLADVNQQLTSINSDTNSINSNTSNINAFLSAINSSNSSIKQNTSNQNAYLSAINSSNSSIKQNTSNQNAYLSSINSSNSSIKQNTNNLNAYLSGINSTNNSIKQNTGNLNAFLSSINTSADANRQNTALSVISQNSTNSLLAEIRDKETTPSEIPTVEFDTSNLSPEAFDAYQKENYDTDIDSVDGGLVDQLITDSKQVMQDKVDELVQTSKDLDKQFEDNLSGEFQENKNRLLTYFMPNLLVDETKCVLLTAQPFAVGPYMTEEATIDWCQYKPQFEAFGHMIFIFANIQAIFIFLGVLGGIRH